LSVEHQAADARVGGTLPYMSPEQLGATAAAEGEAAPRIDPRSDLFSLGVMLYELLSGSHPFGPVPLKLSPEELRDRLRERQRAGHRPLREANPRVDKAVARLVESCLATDPDARPQSAAELAAALRRLLSPPR